MTGQDRLPQPPVPSQGQEVVIVSSFIGDIIRSAICKNIVSGICETQIRKFEAELVLQISQKYVGHWYPSNPLRGTGYREISVHFQFVDKLLLAAGEQSGISKDQLQKALGPDITFFVDPGCVSFRRGCTHNATGTISQLYPKEMDTRSETASPVKTESLVSESSSETSSVSGEDSDDGYDSSIFGSPDSRSYSPGVNERYHPTPFKTLTFGNQWYNDSRELTMAA